MGVCIQEVRDRLVRGAPLADGDADSMLRGGLRKLNTAAQNMFLDTVSVLHGRDSRRALLVWQAWWPGQGGAELKELQRRALINIDDEQRLVVHDVIRSLGRGIIRDPSRPYFGTRAWVEDGQLVKFVEVGTQGF